jgi:translocation and assembly module TamA
VEVVVEGIDDAALANVRETLALPAGLVSDGRVDMLWLKRFAEMADEKALTALEPFGYYNARATVNLDKAGDGKFRLRLVVEPGKPVRVTAAHVGLEGKGAHERLLVSLVEGFPLGKGDVLLQQQYEEAKGNLLAKAQELGYLDAEFSRHEIRIDREKSGAVIDLLLKSGEQYLFDKTTIEGAPDYPDGFLRRNLAYRSGDLFSYGRLGETQFNFTNSERFRDVTVTPEKEAAKGYRVPVLVRLKQAPRRSIRPGAGYGTDTGGRFSLRYRDLNLLHLGHEFSANLFIAERLQGLALKYSVPGYRDLRSSTSLQLNLQREEVTTYTSRLAALELALNRGFGNRRLGTAYLKLQQEEFTIGDQDSSSRLVLPGVRYAADSYDNLIRPGRGYRFAMESRGTHQFLGSDTALLQFIAEGGYITPLPWRLTLQVRGKTGVTLLKDSLSELPPTLRFFAGGDHSVRGYSYQSLGPRDASGSVKGGNHLLFGSIEMERALFNNWGVSLFTDAGNAFDSVPDLHLALGVGAGLHYYTPVGALNLYVARQLGVSNPSIHIHFTVGFDL